MSSNFSIPPYSPSSYSPRDPQYYASQSPWSASSNTGSGYESLTLPPINPNLHFDFNDGEQYFDSLPRIQSPELFLPEPSDSHGQEQQRPPSNQQIRPQQNTRTRQRSEYEVADSESPDPFEDFIDPGFEYLASPRRDDAHAHTHTRSHTHGLASSRSQNTTRASSFVDLTESSPPPPTLDMAPSRKRKADTLGEGRSVRQRLQSSHSTPLRKQQSIIKNADVVDLVDIEDNDQYADYKARQQADAIKQQQQDEANRPVKLAEFQCIICMDNPTDLTVTHCGHLFCSECLHQALYAGTAKKCCPVCRTAISTTLAGRGDQKKQPRNGIFVLEMKLMTANKKGKQPVRPVKPAKPVTSHLGGRPAFV